jgi:hypothetical protein
MSRYLLDFVSQRDFFAKFFVSRARTQPTPHRLTLIFFASPRRLSRGYPFWVGPNTRHLTGEKYP